RRRLPRHLPPLPRRGPSENVSATDEHGYTRIKQSYIKKLYPWSSVAKKPLPVAVDFVAGGLGGGGGGGGVVVAGRGVEDGAGGADHEAGAVGAPGVLHHGLDVAALGADARDQEGQVADDRAHLVQLLGPGRADHQHAVAVRIPFARDRLGHVLVQRQAVGGDDVLEIGGAGVRGPAQHHHALVGALQARQQRIAPEVGVGGDRV